MAKSFVVSTEEINTYNVIIRTNGGDFKAFLKNPIMLFNHDEDDVIGTWENLRVEGTSILADPVFDMEDEEAKKISGKVERGVIKATSISLRPREARDAMVDGRAVIEVTDWELREISIVSIPSNRSALRLLDANDRPINLSENLQLSDILPKSSSEILTPKQSKMELKDVAKKLGLADNATEAEIEMALSDAKKANDDLTALKTQVENERTQRAKKLVDAAILEKRIAANLKDQFIELAKTNFSLFESTLAGIPKPTSLTDFANQGAKIDAEDEDEVAIKLWDKMDRAGTLPGLKKNNPEEFNRLYKAKFKKESK